MIPHKNYAPKYISSQITSESVRANLEQEPSFHFVAKIKCLCNLIQSIPMKNSYSPHRVEIKSKLNEHKIQVNLKEIKDQAEEKGIEHGLKKITISLPIIAVVPVSALGKTQPANINTEHRTHNKSIDVTYQNKYGQTVTLESQF